MTSSVSVCFLCSSDITGEAVALSCLKYLNKWQVTCAVPYSCAAVNSEVDLDLVLYELQRLKFPAHKCKLLVNSLRVARHNNNQHVYIKPGFSATHAEPPTLQIYSIFCVKISNSSMPIAISRNEHKVQLTKNLL